MSMMQEDPKREKIGYWQGKSLSKEHREKIGKALLGKKLAEEHKRNISNSLKGKQHTEEHRRINSEAQKGKRLSEETKKKIGDFWRGKKRLFSEEHKRKISELRLRYNRSWAGKYHTEETKKKISKAHRGMEKPWVIHPDNKGENNSNWQGGKSFELYGVNWTETVKHSIRERDHYTCRICGKTQENIAQDVHHIDYDKQNCNPVNLITLCHVCHVTTNKNRERWIKYFQDKLGTAEK